MHRPHGIIGFAWALLAASAACVPLLLAGQTSTPSEGQRPPKDPAEPAVEILDRKGQDKDPNFPATIVTARGDTKTGSLVLKFNSIEVDSADEGAMQKKAVLIADIDTIEFTRWRGTTRRKNEFAFYPSEIKITLRDKKVLVCRKNIAALNRLAFRDPRGSRIIYSYFYDYRKNSVWKNSGQSDMGYPETNPFEDTLVKITFIRVEMKNPLEKLLSR